MTKVPLNDLGRLSSSLKSELSDMIKNVVSSGWFLKGPHTDTLESQISDRFANRPVITVANGTDALYLALLAAGVMQGKNVATVANAGGYTTGAVLRLGGNPILIDIDQNTAQMSLEALHHVITKTAVDVVVVTHLYGLVGDIGGISELCGERGITLIEDCAQSFGAAVGNRPAGTFGDIATTSFYPTKNLGGFGDGGAVICKTEAIRGCVAELAQYGWGNRYSIERPFGINSRLDEIQAAILSRLLQDLDEKNDRRRSIINHFQSAISHDRYMICEDSDRFVGHLAVLVTPNREVDQSILNKNGIATAIHYPIADHRQLAWRNQFGDCSLSETEWLNSRILTVPCFPEMTENEIEIVASALSKLG